MNSEINIEFSRIPYTIAVDFDGTLCSDKYPEIGDPNYKIINQLKLLRKDGIRIILWTCRAGTLLDKAIEWCKRFGLEFDAINDNILELRMRYPYSGRKITANEYWDDKSVRITFTKEKNDMKLHDATEVAYKNGYNQGIKDITDKLVNESISTMNIYGKTYYVVSDKAVEDIKKELKK